MSNTPYLPNIEALISQGIDPKTGLPMKLAGNKTGLKDAIKRVLRITDEQDAINRYTWYNTPYGIDGNLIERMLFYRGQVAAFYEPASKRVMILPFASVGPLDVYGRPTEITPLPFMGNADTDGKPWIPGFTRKVVYDVPFNVSTEDLATFAVILSDYSKQISPTVLPRQALNESIIDVEAEMIPYARTALRNSTGVQGMRVNTPDEASNVFAMNESMEAAALNGEQNVAVVGGLDFQQLANQPIGNANVFMETMEAIDNFRLGCLGLENGGLFQKTAHMLQSEQAMKGGSASIILNDGLLNRQNFCDILNNYLPLGIDCQVSETASGIDKNMDTSLLDETPNSEIKHVYTQTAPAANTEEVSE